MSDTFIWASKGAKSAVSLLSEAQDISPLGGSHNVSLLGQTSCVKLYIGTAVTQTVHRDILDLLVRQTVEFVNDMATLMGYHTCTYQPLVVPLEGSRSHRL